MDFYPTICAAAGAKFDHAIEGRSILPTLLGEQQPALREISYFTRREGGTRYQGKTIDALIKGPFKLLQNSPYEAFELYNLETDPQETTDLSMKNRAKFNELSADLRRYLQAGGAVPWQKP